MGRPVGKICILRSFEGAQRRIASLYTNIILLWLVRHDRRASCSPTCWRGASWSRWSSWTGRRRRWRGRTTRSKCRCDSEDEIGPAGAHVQHDVRVHPAGARGSDPAGAHLHHRAALRIDRARPAQSAGGDLRRRGDAGGCGSAAGAREAAGGQYLSRVAAHSGAVAGSAERVARQGQRARDVPAARSGGGGVRSAGHGGRAAGRDAGAGDSGRDRSCRWSAAAWSARSPT